MKKPMIDTVVLQYASAHHDFPIDLIQNQYPELKTAVKHVIQLPILCQASQNPKAGSTISIHYIADQVLLELFSLEKYIKAFIGHKTVRDLEYFTQAIAIECQNALKVEVTVQADIILEGLNQSQVITVTVPQM